MIYDVLDKNLYRIGGTTETEELPKTETDVETISTGSSVGETTVSSGSIASAVYEDTVKGWKLDANGDAQINNLVLTGGQIRYGKTSFTDSTNSGYFISSEGIYFSSASDATKFKFTISSGAMDFIGTLSNSAGSVILDAASQTILKDFSFSPSDYSGAFKTGNITWNTTTGAITGGTGGVFFKGGLVFASAGVPTITLDGATGAATFAGTLSAPSGSLGTITGGILQTASSGARSLIDGTTTLKGFKSFDASDNLLFSVYDNQSGSGTCQILSWQNTTPLYVHQEYASGANPVLYASNMSGATSPIIQILQNGTGYDILGTDSSWYISKDGSTNLKTGDVTFGSGYDGDLTTSGNITLSRDMYYNNLTVGHTINCAGYRIFVKGTLTINNGGYIHRDGNNGSAGGNGGNASNGVNGVAGVGGTGGAALAAGTVIGSSAGTNGGDGQGNQGVANPFSGAVRGTVGPSGSNGASVAKSIGSVGANGNSGGSTRSGGDVNVNVGGGGGSYQEVGRYGSSIYGTAGTQTGTVLQPPYGVISAYNLNDGGTAYGASTPAGTSSMGGLGAVGVVSTFSNNCQARSGGTGGHGGCGGQGGVVVIFAKNIVINSGGIISANGGAGGNGGNAGSHYVIATMTGEGAAAAVGGACGGAGGTGGTGGVIILIYKSLTNNGTIRVNGGTGGNGGSKTVGATSVIGSGSADVDVDWVASDGQSGSNGNAGVIYSLAI